MPTTDELQSQINALQSQLNSILGMADDDYIHQYSGEEIDAGITAAGGAVRYDLAQSLTTAQQAQARENIGADAVQGAVRYDQAQSLTTAQQAQARGNIAAMQGISSSDYPGCYYVLNGSNVEWVNPPLALGVEYRTTERYLGKPVYIRLEEVAALPNNTILTVSNVGVPSGGTLYVDNIVDYRAEFYRASAVFSIPYNDVVDVPQCTGSRYGSGITYSIRTKADYTNFAGRIWIKYTKQTD